MGFAWKEKKPLIKRRRVAAAGVGEIFINKNNFLLRMKRWEYVHDI